MYNFKKVVSGAVFVCVAGTRVDSHEFVPQVLKVSTRVLVMEWGIEEEVTRSGLSPKELTDMTIPRIEGGRHVLTLLSVTRFGYPAKRMITTGITGTKGKTTTTRVTKAISGAAGKKTGMIGAMGVVVGDTVTPTVNTTPESWQPHQAFSQMVENGCQCMIMEVSSQGIKMRRVDRITFDYSISTNISPDHIGPDEHMDFGRYLYYKSRVLNMCKVGLVNANDSHFKAVVGNVFCTIHAYSVLKEGGGVPDADLTASNTCYVSRPDFAGTELDVKGRYEIDTRFGIPGLLNVDNALATVSICSFLNFSRERISHALEHVRVNGRMEIVRTSARCTVLVGYAHNAVSTENLLSTLCQYHPERLVVALGRDGNRSKECRYFIGEIGRRLANLSIVATDNSRFEKVEDIIADIRRSIEKTEGALIEIPNRREAIEYGATHTRPGDMTAVIGKGHEDYQEIDGMRYHFLDREVAEEAVSRSGSEA